MRVLILLVLVITLAQSLDVKHLAGPASEFPLHKLPDPKATITREKSYTENIWFQSPGADQVVYSKSIPVDGPSDFVFSFASPHSQNLKLELLDPSGKEINLDEAATESYWPVGEEKIPVTVYFIKNSVKGVYKLNMKTGLSVEEVSKLIASPVPNAELVLINNDNVQILSHLSSYVIKVGEPLGIVSTIVDFNTGLAPTNIQVTSAAMGVMQPDGSDIEVPMSDDAEFLDAPHPGVYAAQISVKEAGDYVFQTKLQGFFQSDTSADVVVFERTTQHLVQVSSATVELSGTAQLRAHSDRFLIDIAVKNIDTPQPSLRAYAEVWGTNPETKVLEPACWIGGAVDINNGLVTLELDKKWLQLAGVSGPLVLNGVYLADMDTSFPVTYESNNVAVQNSNIEIELTPEMRTMQITEEMRFGVNPLRRNATAVVDSAVVLLHGYCANSNPFQTYSEDFTNAYFFLNQLANVGNDEFAKRVLAFVASNNIGSFSLIGHSQGGTVGTHIRNYYWSGLDLTNGGRHVQSVGTPYLGCTGAGNSANLIKIFGFGCGANNDLTVDGTTAWLTGISSASRKDVYFYTTTYEIGNWFGDYCNMAVNLVLEWPNDGTTELEYAVLPGGNNMGNTEKQCHVSDMSYPAQYWDRNRNKEMNSLAAR